MRLVFLGTRGYIDARTPRHRMHAALLVSHRGGRVMIDCGEDWINRIGRLRPEAILVTHAHPDHAGGLRKGAPCPVFATAAAWRGMTRFAIASRDRRVVTHRRPWQIAGITFEAFPVAHSIRAPAVGYRIGASGARVFYVPDVLSIPERSTALGDVDLYVGDGASIVRAIVRHRGRIPFGHASIDAQLAWCRAEGVPRAIFTHCGSQIVGGDARRSGARIARLAQARGVESCIARDGMVYVVGARGRRADRLAPRHVGGCAVPRR